MFVSVKLYFALERSTAFVIVWRQGAEEDMLTSEREC
jgi:hypothetical protein